MIKIEDPTDILIMYNTPQSTANGFLALANEFFNGDLEKMLRMELASAKATKDLDHVRVAYGSYFYWREIEKKNQ